VPDSAIFASGVHPDQSAQLLLWTQRNPKAFVTPRLPAQLDAKAFAEEHAEARREKGFLTNARRAVDTFLFASHLQYC